MTEEQVTKAILSWLKLCGWEIVSFDFPQSGTGRLLHADNTQADKNKDAIIPDIVAVRNKLCVFFENKDRFYYPDYQKINELITDNRYKLSIDDLLSDYNVEKIFYGIGLPSAKHSAKAADAKELTNFVIGVNEDFSVVRIHDPCQCFR